MPNWLTCRPPAIPAKKAEIEKTSRRLVLTLTPWVASMVGVSVMARSSRPRRLRHRAMMAVTERATMTSTT